MIAPKAFNTDSEIDTLVLFRGGTSGNFLQHLIENKIRGIKTSDSATALNEYLPIQRMSDVIATHINLLYGVHHTVEDVTGLSAINIMQMLNNYVKNIVHVVNKTDPQWTSHLGGIKHSAGVTDSNGKCRGRRDFNSVWVQTQWNFSKQYQWFYEEILLKHYTGNLFYLDYEDFFVNGNTDPLCDFLGSANYLEVNQTVKKYHDENVRLMRNAGWEWNKHA